MENIWNKQKEKVLDDYLQKTEEKRNEKYPITDGKEQ